MPTIVHRRVVGGEFAANKITGEGGEEGVEITINDGAGVLTSCVVSRETWDEVANGIFGVVVAKVALPRMDIPRGK